MCGSPDTDLPDRKARAACEKTVPRRATVFPFKDSSRSIRSVFPKIALSFLRKIPKIAFCQQLISVPAGKEPPDFSRGRSPPALGKQKHSFISPPSLDGGLRPGSTGKPQYRLSEHPATRGNSEALSRYQPQAPLLPSPSPLHKTKKKPLPPLGGRGSQISAGSGPQYPVSSGLRFPFPFPQHRPNHIQNHHIGPHVMPVIPGVAQSHQPGLFGTGQ